MDPEEDASKRIEAELLTSSSSKIESKAASSNAVDLSLACSLSHQILTLIGFTFLLFEIVFLIFYFDKFWFSLDLSMLGVIAILILCVLTHLLLKSLESRQMCKFLSFLFKGKPPIPYRKWICTNGDGLTFGIKHIRWDVIDELELSWFGNLIVKSRRLCGNSQAQPDVILKIPFGIADNAAQVQFLNVARSQCPQVVLNNKLEKVDATLAKGAQITQIVTAAIMSFVLLDVGYASFYYLELLKNLYQAEITLLQHPNPADPTALQYFEHAENLRLHPLPISWVTGKFLGSSTVAAGLCIQRAKIMWLLGKKDEALQLCEKSFEYSPNSLRHHLYKTRLLVEDNKVTDAQKELDKIIADHKSALLPRLYVLALANRSPEASGIASTQNPQTDVEFQNHKPEITQEYENQLAACYAETFGDEPYWPPGGNRFFTELWYSEDLRFLMDRFLRSKPNMERVHSKSKELETAKTEPKAKQ